jgi:hypothetical protein
MNKNPKTTWFVLLAGLGIILVSIFFLHQSKILNQEDAIKAVIAAYPELAAYQTTSLPPSSIEAKQVGEIWYFGFIQSGSGVPGILNAKCYQVSGKTNVATVGVYSAVNGKTAEKITLETCEPVFPEAPAPVAPTPPSSEQPHILPYGNVTLKLNQLATFKNISLRPLSVEEDSRCPSDVQCIWAGTVRVKVEVVSGMGKSVSILTLGEAFTTEAEVITLTDVLPYSNSKVKITDKDYRFVFNVVPQGTIKNPGTQAKCYVGGCSSQLCTDKPDAISTCEYTAAYACYKTATCERQPSGECGWTPSAELSACLAGV